MSIGNVVDTINEEKNKKNYFTRNHKIFEIHSFEEYFKQFISTGEYEIKKQAILTIRVPFSTKNNK